MLNNRRVSLTNEFSYSLKIARSEAISRNQRVTVCATSTGVDCAAKNYWSSGWIVFNDIDLDGDTGGDGEVVLLEVSGNDSTIITPTGVENTITYRPNGRMMGEEVADNTAEFVFCDSRGAAHARVLIVGANGRPRLSETMANDAAPSCS
jgi:type IV fimbrial biogenesis protein FimT